VKERRKKLLSGHSYSFFLPILKKKRSEHRVRQTVPGLRSLPEGTRSQSEGGAGQWENKPGCWVRFVRFLDILKN